MVPQAVHRESPLHTSLQPQPISTPLRVPRCAGSCQMLPWLRGTRTPKPAPCWWPAWGATAGHLKAWLDLTQREPPRCAAPTAEPAMGRVGVRAGEGGARLQGTVMATASPKEERRQGSSSRALASPPGVTLPPQGTLAMFRHLFSVLPGDRVTGMGSVEAGVRLPPPGPFHSRDLPARGDPC